MSDKETIVHKRLSLVRNLLTSILDKNRECIEKLRDVFDEIDGNMEGCDDAFMNYLEDVSSVIVAKARHYDESYNPFYEDIDQTIEFFKDDLEFMKADKGVYDIEDVKSLINEVRDLMDSQSEKESHEANYDQRVWEEARLWVRDAEHYIQTYEIDQERGTLLEEDEEYLRQIGTCLLYYKIVIDRVSESGKVIDRQAFGRMLGEDPENFDEPPPF